MQPFKLFEVRFDQRMFIDPILQIFRIVGNRRAERQIADFGRYDRIAPLARHELEEFPGRLLFCFVIGQNEQCAAGIDRRCRLVAESRHRSGFQFPTPGLRGFDKCALQRARIKQHTELAFTEGLHDLAVVQLVVRPTQHKILPHPDGADRLRLTVLDALAVVRQHFAAVAADQRLDDPIVPDMPPI